MPASSSFSISDRYPVIIGVGFCQEKLEDASASHEASALMVKAIENAAQDAGQPELVKQLESICVLKGMWDYKNPGKLIADAFGASHAKSILADVGNLQLSALFDLCRAIQSGEQDIGVVVGGEAKYRELRAKITGQHISNTVQGDETALPDLYVGIPDPFATDAEANAGLFMPVELFSVIESAIRASQGLSLEAHRDTIAQLYSDYSKIAANNPRAWSHEVLSAEEIRNATDKNAMLAFPYTKKFNSQWNVNQAAAILVCSAAKARALGLDSKRWVYPLAGTQSKHVVCLAEKKNLHTQPGAVIAGQRAYALAGITPTDITVADLYSCFPSAVQIFGHDLKLDHIPWSVSGSMAFGGGPYNHASIDSVVRIVDVIRKNATQERQIGMVSNLSGIFGKQAVALFSNQPNRSSPRGKGFYFEDVTAQVAKIDLPMTVNANYNGIAKIVGYTVVYVKNMPSHAFVYCESPAAERTVAKSLDQELLARMTREEFVGKAVQVHADKTFSLVA
jgi:acetyl-CoA C-acetyltransferase